MSDSAIICCEQLSKKFHDGKLDVTVLRELSLSIAAGEQVAIVGASGAGKSTLLHMLGGLERPSTGCVKWQGQSLETFSENQLSRMRNQMLGFVYQFHHLLPEFTALENVTMPLLLRKISIAQAQQLSQNMLDAVGLAHRYKHKLAELSGGERQRVAIARALVTQPKCVLADEPTGNLDAKTAQKIYELMIQLNRQSNTSFVIVTHDKQLAARMDRCIQLSDGSILS